MAKLNVTIPINDKQEYKKFNLSPEVLKPQAAKGGNYGVVVGDTLRAEQTSMGQLANALGNFGGPLLSGYAKLTETRSNRTLEEIQTYSDEKKRELLKLGKDLNKELRRMGLNANHSLTVQRSLGDVEVSPAMTDWNKRLEEITQAQANGSQLTQKQLNNEFQAWRSNYIANSEALGLNIYAKESFVTSTDALFARNQGAYMKTADTHYDTKVRNPNIGSALVTAFEQSPENWVSKYNELTGDMSKTEVLEVLDWISTNTEGLSQKNNYKEMLIDLQQDPTAKIGTAPFSSVSNLELGMTKLDETIKGLKNKDELTNLQLAAKRRAEELEEVKGDFFKEYNAAVGPEAKEAVIDKYRNRTYNIEGFTTEDNTMMYGDVNEWLIAMENSHDADIKSDDLKLDKTAKEITDEYTIKLNNAVISGDADQQKELITEITDFVTENTGKLGATRLKDLSDLALSTHNGLNSIKISTVNSIVNVMEKPLVRNNAFDAFTALKKEFNIGTTADQFLLTEEAYANHSLDMKAYVFNPDDLKPVYRGYIAKYSNDVERIMRESAEMALKENPSLVGDTAGLESAANLIARPLLDEAKAELNKNFTDQYQKQKEEKDLQLQRVTGLTEEQLEQKVKRGEIASLNQVYEAKGNNPYEFERTADGMELKIFDGFFRNVYEGDFDGNFFTRDNKQINEEFLGHYIETFRGRQTNGQNLIHYVSPSSKAANHKAALGALKQSNLVEELITELRTGETTSTYAERHREGDLYLEGKRDDELLVGVRDVGFFDPSQVTYKLTFSQIEERQQKLADYLAITGVVDEFDSGEINGLPLFGTDGYLTRFSDKIQTVPTDIIKNIDANESNPADNELIKSRAEKLGVSPQELYNTNKRILTRQGHQFSEDNIEITID